MQSFRDLLTTARNQLRDDVALHKAWYTPYEELLCAFEVTNKQLRFVARDLFRRIEMRLRSGTYEKLGSLTPVKFNILRTLDDFSPKSQREIEDTLVYKIDKASLSDVIKQLLEARLIRRQRSREDRRAWEIGITARGRKLLATIEEDYLRLLPRLFRGFTRAQQNDLLVLLHLLKSNLVALREELED